MIQIIDLIHAEGEVKTAKKNLRRYLLRAALMAYERLHYSSRQIPDFAISISSTPSLSKIRTIGFQQKFV